MAEKVAEKIKKLKALRQSEIQKINDLLTVGQRARTDADVRPMFKTMCADVDEIKSEFSNQHTALISLVFNTEDEFKDALAIMSNFNKTFYEVKNILNSFSVETPAVKAESGSVNPAHINLPKIQLIKFKGDIQSFPTYLDMYDSLVHNNASLSAIEKFNYLISSLEGPPLSVVKCLQMSSANYEIAYTTLVKRYKNTRLLSQVHWSAIENSPKLNSDEPHALRNLLDIFSENLEALKILKHPVEHWDFILVTMLLKKIDISTATRNVHKLSNCNSSSVCRTCNKRHHSLLHFERPVDSGSNRSAPSASTDTNNISLGPESPTQTHTLAGFSGTDSTSVLLSTARVEVLDIRGHYQIIRAIIDTGSQTSLITQKCANRLGLPRRKIHSEIHGIGSTDVHSQLGCVYISLRPLGKPNSDLTADAIILPRICSDLPGKLLPKDGWSHIRNLTLADPDFDKPGNIDLLLGADLFPLIIQNGRVIGNANEPVALNTIFGFVLMGKFENTKLSHVTQSLLCQSEQQSLNDMLSKFWELENIPNKTAVSPDNELCEQLYLKTVTRAADGRFTVSLPFKDKLPSFCNSRDIAFNRFLSLERRLLKNPSLYVEYSQFMQEYLDLNHMELLNDPIYTDTSTYIDDVVTGCDSIDDALALQTELIDLLKRGGFELHKWASNKPEVLSHLPQSPVNFATHSLDSEDITKVLGLCWQPPSDTFTYKVAPIERSCTKRNILSELARVFDPLGFLTPITFYIKCLIQKLWVLGLSWDDKPPNDIQRVWKLCAAVLLSDLIDFVLKTYEKINFLKMYAWTDSAVTLSWIKSHPHRWKPFVSNRISFIQERVDPKNWWHVVSSQNPADVASRGAFPSDLLTNSLWWAAPDFLKHRQDAWPVNKLNTLESTEMFDEEKRNVTLTATIAPVDNFFRCPS
ncbi:hypothetical protein NQ317_005821 [Molorchus minor]|uniref:Peptidase A2 domain-containing protein n=1 Tax=Molorchus minor TaxID=1323400 RepID=A0ABQ9IR78_9CUCU|nr:hypothetical protein NQ317_005821 [Molorchus minor]